MVRKSSRRGIGHPSVDPYCALLGCLTSCPFDYSMYRTQCQPVLPTIIYTSLWSLSFELSIVTPGEDWRVFYRRSKPGLLRCRHLCDVRWTFRELCGCHQSRSTYCGRQPPTGGMIHRISDACTHFLRDTGKWLVVCLVLWTQYLAEAVWILESIHRSCCVSNTGQQFT